MNGAATPIGSASPPLRADVPRPVLIDSARTGEEYFEALVRQLAVALPARAVLVAEFLPPGPGVARTLALFTDGGLRNGIEFALEGTPCEGVRSGALCHHPSGVAHRFPADRMLADMGAERYVGIPLFASSGDVIGLLAAIDAPPPGSEVDVETVFLLVADRAAAELERLQNHRLLSDRLAFESLLATLAARLLRAGPGEMDAALAEGLSDVARWLCLDTIGLWESDDDGSWHPHRLLAPGTDIQVQRFVICDESLPFYARSIRAGQALLFSDISDLPAEARAERNLWSRCGLVSSALVPLGSSSRGEGAVAFSSTRRRVEWRTDVVLRLELLSEVFGHALSRCRSENRLKESESRARAVFEQATSGIGICSLDGRFLDVNPRLCAITGDSREQLLGRSLHDSTHPDDVAADLDGVARLLAGESREFRMERRYLRMDGVTAWVDLSVSVIRDDAGRPTRLLAVIEDVSARRASEAALHESEARLRLNTQALEAAANAISITGRDGRIVWSNAALSRLTGFAPEEIVGQTHRIFDSGYHGSDFWSAFWNTIIGGRVWRGEVVNRRRNGSTYTEEMTVTPVVDLNGTPSHFVAVKHDVTVRRQMEKELRREVALSASVESLSQALLRARTVRETLALAIAEARRITSSPMGFAAPVDPTSGHLQLPAHVEGAFEMRNDEGLPKLEAPGGVWDRIATSRRPLFSNDVRTDPRLASIPEGLVPIERYVGVPALHGDALAGVLAVANGSRDYDRSDMRALERIAAALALGLERARAEEAQRASEAAVRALLDASPEVEMLLDAKGVILDANRRALDEIGRTREQLLGTDFLRLFPRSLAQGRRERLVEVSGSGRSVSFEEMEQGRLYEVTIVPVRDPAGRVARVALHARDVSRARHLESELRRMATEWRQTSDALPLAIFVVDPFDRILRLNQTGLQLLGRESFNEVIGTPLSDLIESEPWAAIARSVARARAGVLPDPREVGDASSRRTWLVGASPLSWLATEGQWTLAYATDVTAVEELREKLRRAEKMAEMGALMGGVAHEVRNPLFAISANVDVLELELASMEHMSEVLEALRTGVSRLGSLMEDLLEYGRPPRARPQPTPLRDTMAVALRTCGPLARSLGVRLLPMMPDASVRVLAETERLPRVFENLLQNACQHSPAGGTVRIRCDVPSPGTPRMVRFLVEDDGPGIPDADLPRLFEPFFTNRQGGTGLGLAIVERIVLDHSGQIRAGNGPSGGAWFEVLLPLCAAERY